MPSIGHVVWWYHITFAARRGGSVTMWFAQQRSGNLAELQLGGVAEYVAE